MERKEFCEMIRVAVEEAGASPMYLMKNKIAPHYYEDIRGERNFKLNGFISVLKHIGRVLVVSFENKESIEITNESDLQDEIIKRFKEIGNQSEVARMMQCSKGKISDIKNKKVGIPIDTLLSFCEAFQCGVEIKKIKDFNIRRKEFCQLIKSAISESGVLPVELVRNKITPNYYEEIKGERNFKVATFINLLKYLNKSIVLSNGSLGKLKVTEENDLHREIIKKIEEVGNQSEVARMMRCSRARITELKNKRTGITIDLLYSFCDSFNYMITIE